MTVHKSQGSEFDKVVFILPSEESAVLCRELIYTAITRSREKLWLWGDKNIFDFALSKKTRRASGLAEMLK
jgi:exodeoxyribonuclease V alpha subunit